MLEGIGECDVVLEGEMPFVVFHPAVLVLCFLLIGRGVAVCGKSLVLDAVPEGVRWCECEGEVEVGASTWEESVVDARAVEVEGEVDVVAVSVGDEEVLPVLQHIACISECHAEGEVVVGPAETFSESYAQSYQAYPFVGVVVVGVVVVTGVCTVSVVIVIEVVVIVVVEVGVNVALL